jgi:predicted alpha/beta-fold hydrolase
VQTLCAALPCWTPTRDERALFPLADGDSLLAYASWQARAIPRDTCVLVHGAGGSSESGYMRRSALALVARGYHVLRLNLRGAGDGVHHASAIYHAGQTGDLDHAVRGLAADPRIARLFLIGFSLGGSQLLKLAGEWGSAWPTCVAAIATLSAPTDFPAVSAVLDATLAYRRAILRGVVRQALAFARVHPRRACYDRDRLRQARTIREYDEQVMVPMHRFDGIRDYYESTSSKRWLPAIGVRTLMLHAKDDPIIPARTVAPTLPSASPAVEVEWTSHGGHVGWIDGIRTPPWSMRRVTEFFERVTTHRGPR